MTGPDVMADLLADSIEFAAIARKRFDKLLKRFADSFDLIEDDQVLLHELSSELCHLRVQLAEATRLAS
jgi:hypothetical protein